MTMTFQHELTFIPAEICNYIYDTMGYGITNSFPRIIMYMITCPRFDLSLIHVGKWAPGDACGEGLMKHNFFFKFSPFTYAVNPMCKMMILKQI